MPILAWRNDSDGFAFDNTWTFDAAERAALTALAELHVPAVLASVLALVPPDPILVTAVTAAAIAGAAYPAAGSLPTYGLCGGMSYASLDYWNARVALPRGAHVGDHPARSTSASTTLRDLLWSRLLDSLAGGGVLLKTMQWSLLLNEIPAALGGGPPALLSRTRAEWDMLRGHIDAGRPWPIGLVYTGRAIWFQHQVLVFGYKVAGNGTVSLDVYDCNHANQFGDKSPKVVTLDFTGSALVASTPSDGSDKLAGFFCSNYVPSTPPAIAAGYGEFLTWSGSSQTWMVTNGARMLVSGTSELTALGGTAANVRTAIDQIPSPPPRPRDGTLLRERSAAPVFLYQGGAPFWVPDPTWLQRFGGWGATRTVPDNTIASFIGLPDEGTLLREWSDPKVYRIMGPTRRWVTTPAELEKWGGFVSVRVVPDGALASISLGEPLPTPVPGECASLRAEIARLDTQIASLIARLADIADEAQARPLRRALLEARTRRTQAAARAAALQCPP